MKPNEMPHVGLHDLYYPLSRPTWPTISYETRCVINLP
jgi:hypothetical protein